MPFLYRGHFVFLRSPRMTSTGLNVSALIGFANGVTSILGEYGPTHAVLAMDPGGPTFRHEAYPPYKAQREQMPEDLAANIPYAFELAEALGLPVVRKEGFEADDVMGTLATRAAQEGFEVYCATPDKDAAQLVGPHIRLFRPGHGKEGPTIYDEARVKEHWSLAAPAQMIDYLALAGDTSDNIPGIRGVGEKTASTLLAQYGSVEEIIAHAGEIKGRLGERIAAGAEDAKMSKFLTTIRRDVPLGDIDWNAFARPPLDGERVAAVCAKYELNRLAKRLLGRALPVAPASLAPAASDAAAEPVVLSSLADWPHDYRLVTTEAAARELAATLEAAPKFAFDTETTGMDARTVDLVGMSFATEPGRAWYVAVPPHGGGPAEASSNDLFVHAARTAARPAAREAARRFVQIFARAFADPSKTLVAQNGKYDRTVLERYGIVFGSTVRDTMLEHYVTDAAARHGLDALAREFLRYDPVPITRLIGEKERGREQKNMADLPPEAICDYAAEDADVALRLDAVLRPRAAEMGALPALEQSEEPLVPVLVEMEREGVKIDVSALGKYGLALDREITARAAEILSYGDPGLNIDSPKQLADLLYVKLGLRPKGAKKMQGGLFSTDEKALQTILDDHPVVRKILDYRACAKLKSTYVDKLPQCIDPADGRVHTTFSQSFAETGRLSSSDPNLQNIPVRSDLGRMVRTAFVPAGPDNVILSCDYSQIELRLLAHLSGDEGLVEAFLSGEDFHRETASKVFGVPASEVTPAQRSRAKAVNFGIVYGQTAWGLSQTLKISAAEAQEMIDRYYATYPGVRVYLNDQVELARKQGFVQTMFGRKRHVPNIAARVPAVRQFAERTAMNHPMQGSAADIIKLAMVRVQRKLLEGAFKAKMIVQVHDELDFDCPRSEVEALQEMVVEQMQGIAELRVPLLVSCSIGQNWAEAK